MAPSESGRLDSWKEIAEYLRRGARTVQRWEREQGLPVHRLVHDQGSTVYAYKSELDSWWAKHSTQDETPARHDLSVAVLPFIDLSHEQDQEYFCEGVAEEIINTLARVRRLRVASRTAAFQFKGAADTRDIGKRLRVATLLEGSVRKSGNRLRIAVQLTDADTGYQLWSSRFDRNITDIFAVQDEIAHSVASALEPELTAEEASALRRAPTNSPQAYDYYLRGRSSYYRYNRRDVALAVRLFERAVEIDPGFAMAHAGLADCWSYLYLYADRSEANRKQAETASLRAVELDPESAPAQASRGVALSMAGRDADAEAAFEKAIRLDPAGFEAHYFYARHAFGKGELPKAVRLYEDAMRVRPEDHQSPLLVAQSYEVLGEPEKARLCRRRGVKLAEEHLRLHPEDARAVYMAANGYAGLGEAEAAKSWADRALEMQPDEPMVLYNVGCVYSLLGLTDPAIECLERAVQTGLTQKGWFDHDSNLDSVRPDPRFQKLIGQLR